MNSFTCGFVVKERWMEEKAGEQIERIRQIGRIYHAKAAAEQLAAHMAKQFPDRKYWVHEKQKTERVKS